MREMGAEASRRLEYRAGGLLEIVFGRMHGVRLNESGVRLVSLERVT